MLKEVNETEHEKTFEIKNMIISLFLRDLFFARTFNLERLSVNSRIIYISLIIFLNNIKEMNDVFDFIFLFDYQNIFPQKTRSRKNTRNPLKKSSIIIVNYVKYFIKFLLF